MTVLIVGAGQIAREYVDICLDIGTTPLVVTRGESRAAMLRKEHPSVEVVAGGLQPFLERNEVPDTAILATPIPTLTRLCETLIQAGTSQILAEKPLVLSSDAARDLRATASRHSAVVLVGFNRRHYESVRLARKAISEDGGVSSCWIDFTEATFRINPDKYDDTTLRKWGIANSSHILDLAFFLCGPPETVTPERDGEAIDWHPAGSRFYGNGRTEDNVPFSYHADWGAPGSWRLEINTPERKLLFSPLERLQVQKSGTFETVEYEGDYELDREYKPGFYRQTDRFLTGSHEQFPTLESLETELATIEQIFGYE